MNNFEEESLEDLSNKQIFLLMKNVTNDVLKEANEENKNTHERLLNYFMKKDIYKDYNALYGMFWSVNRSMVSSSAELDCYRLNDVILRSLRAIEEFNDNFKPLKYCLSKIYTYYNNSKIVKELNELIEFFYVNMFCAKEDNLVDIIIDNKESIECKIKHTKELINDYEDLTVDNRILENLETYFKLLFDSLDEYYKNVEEFEAISEDGFIFLKEKDPTNDKINLVYDFSDFDIKEAVTNES